MKVEWVRSRVRAVEREGEGDNESAHCAEDDLYRRVLRAIAKGAPNARELASEAIKAADLDYRRWYA